MNGHPLLQKKGFLSSKKVRNEGNFPSTKFLSIQNNLDHETSHFPGNV